MTSLWRAVRWGILAVGVAVIVVGVAGAASDPPAKDRVEAITRDLRCPTCEAESVAGSMATSARDITEQVEQQVAAGWTDEQIRRFYVERYGDWILLDPPRTGTTLVLWLVPVFVLASGATVLAGRLESSRSRRLVVGVAAVASVSMVAVLVVSGMDDRSRQLAVPPPLPVAGDDDDVVDLATVSDEAMEAVIAENPTIVGMRLALAERYLEKGEVDDAVRHTAVAIELPATDQELQRALRLHGWASALSGAPASGALYLRAALELSPDDRDAWWYLARVEFSGLGDVEAAAAALERIDGTDMTAEQRSMVDDLRALIDAGAGGGRLTATDPGFDR
jgi:cytochrome c-type biogenesis protein CcmH